MKKSSELLDSMIARPMVGNAMTSLILYAEKGTNGLSNVAYLGIVARISTPFEQTINQVLEHVLIGRSIVWR